MATAAGTATPGAFASRGAERPRPEFAQALGRQQVAFDHRIHFRGSEAESDNEPLDDNAAFNRDQITTDYAVADLRRRSGPSLHTRKSPIDYLDGGRIVRGYDASILVAVCNVWLKAREKGALQKQQLPKVQQAEVLTRALAETGIVALIDEVTGYQKVRPQNALQAYLEMVIRKELAAWATKFPDEFYENIYKLKGWKWPGMSKNRFSIVAHYTKDLVYSRLGPGVLEEPEKKSQRNEKGYRPNKLHQWLAEDVGNPMLAQHLHAVMMFQRLAIANGYSWKRFFLTVDQVLPRRGSTLELPFTFGEPNEP
jgi:P63C domain